MPVWPLSVLRPAGTTDDDGGPGALPEAELLAERLAGWCTTHPDVEVVRRLPEGRPAGELVRWSDTARLLVLGTRGRRGLAALGRSVSRFVLGRAGCPVAVVPPHPGGRTTIDPAGRARRTRAPTGPAVERLLRRATARARRGDRDGQHH